MASDYERARLERIEQNEAFLISLKLIKPKATPTVRVAHACKPRNGPSRRSARIAGDEAPEVRLVDVDDVERPAKRARCLKLPAMTDEQREALASADWLPAFQLWFMQHGSKNGGRPSISNIQKVMARVSELASGHGLQYKTWDTPFNAGNVVNMQTDLIALYKAAAELEDPSNGWFSTHPIKKLLLFQLHCLEQPDALVADVETTTAS